MINLVIATVLASWALQGPAPWSVDQAYMAKKQSEIQELKDYAFDTNVKTRQTTGVLVIRQGKIVFEHYVSSHNKNTRHPTWSVSKGIVNALVGMAIKDGKLKLADSICKYGFTRHCEITIDSLLKWSSGLDWQEAYEASQKPEDSDVLNMLYRQRGHRNMVGYVLDRPLGEAPGQRWNYSSGDSNVLMAVLKNIYGNQYNDMPWKKLFNPLGMKTAVWEQDEKGVFVGSSYVFLSARDLARFGQLYVANGKIRKTQVWPKQWVEYSAAPSASMKKRADIWELGAVGGAHWWANKPHPNKSIPRPVPTAPEDMMACRGHWGQFLFVIPSKDVLVVRFGTTRTKIDEDTQEESFDPRKFMELVMNVVEE